MDDRRLFALAGLALAGVVGCGAPTPVRERATMIGVPRPAPSWPETHTERDGTSFVLRTELPFDPTECAHLEPKGGCADGDGDGLVDRWEDIAIDRLRPFVVLDEGESLVGDPEGMTGSAARVFRAGDKILVFIMLGYAKDYGSCGFTAHAGDSERVALLLEPMGTEGDVRAIGFYTAAHEGAPNDRGRVYGGDGIAELSFFADMDIGGEPRWTVYASRDKHATYGSISACEAASQLPCFEEDCAPDGVARPDDFRILMPFVNVGEPSAPRASELGDIGFFGEDAWADRPFCGAVSGTSCATAVRVKMVVSPFPD